MSQENALDLLKQEMQCEETHVQVNAVHRLKTVILSIGPEETASKLIPQIDDIIANQDDEVLFAVAEVLGKVFDLLPDKTLFLPCLEQLAKHHETVVRDQAAKSLAIICERLSDAEVQNVFAPLVIKLAQDEWMGRVSSSSLFFACYSRSGPNKDKLRKKFIELCNEDTPMIRRACASQLGVFSTQLEKQYILQEILPIFRQLSQDEQDAIRVMCLESLIPMAKHLSKEENQIHTLGTLLAAGEDKSWKVRLAFARNFADFAISFGKEITDNNLIQTFSVLLGDNEAEVRHAAITNVPNCLKYLSTEKLIQLMLPTLIDNYSENTAQYKAGTATALSEMSQFIGKDFTSQKVLPILQSLLTDDNPEVKLCVIKGLLQISKIIGVDLITTGSSLTTLSNMIREGQWRVRMGVVELIADLGIIYGKDVFVKHLQPIFMGYLTNTAASVRQMGIEKSAILAQNFKEFWIMQFYVPQVLKQYDEDKKGYNYRICCLNSLAAVMPFITKEQINQNIVPTLVKASKDNIPNVKFCMSKIVNANKKYIDSNVYESHLVEPLKEMTNDQDKDVVYFAKQALHS